ncbi:hypothetical protein ACLBWT_17205 [Paenibacillus sp. D51F]
MGRVIRLVEPDAVLAALLASAALLLVNDQLSCAVILLCSVWLLTRDRGFWSRYLNFAFFAGIGYFAAHRFDVDKLPDWGIGIMLPLLAVIALLRLHSAPESNPVLAAGFSRVLGTLRLHWLPFSLLAGTILSLLAGNRLSVYAGAALILLILLLLERSVRLRAGFVLMGVYVLLLTLFAQHGLTELRIRPLSFAASHWEQAVSPLLILLILHAAVQWRSKGKGRQP